MTNDPLPFLPDPRCGALPAPRAARTPDVRAAWLELVRVHELEEARLLREACRLRGGVERGAGGCASDIERRLGRWRRRTEEALALALADALEPPACLRFCAAHAIARWPAVEELARASLALEDCAAGRRLAAAGRRPAGGGAEGHGGTHPSSGKQG